MALLPPRKEKKKELICSRTHRRGNILPFSPMIKLMFGPKGTSSILWHMKSLRIIFSRTPASETLI
jgi:hypothetical protein